MKDAATLHVKQVFEVLKTSPRGLTSEEANRRLVDHGPNVLVEKKHVSIIYKFLGQLKDLFGVLLLFASLLAAIDAIWENSFSMWETSAIIFAVVLVTPCSAFFKNGALKERLKPSKVGCLNTLKSFGTGN